MTNKNPNFRCFTCDLWSRIYRRTPTCFMGDRGTTNSNLRSTIRSSYHFHTTYYITKRSNRRIYYLIYRCDNFFNTDGFCFRRWNRFTTMVPSCFRRGANASIITWTRGDFLLFTNAKSVPEIPPSCPSCDNLRTRTGLGNCDWTWFGYG